MGHVRVIIVAVEKQQILNVTSTCLHSCCSFLAFKAHAPYHIVISGICGSNKFSLFSHELHDFGGKNIVYKMHVSSFSTTSARNVSNSNNNSARYYHKFTQLIIHSTRYDRQNLIKLDFRKVLRYKI
jgi:hypothetical protein